MTKIQKLEWENQKMKKALEEIYALCNMEDQEQKKYLEKFEINHPQFYPIAVGGLVTWQWKHSQPLELKSREADHG